MQYPTAMAPGDTRNAHWYEGACCWLCWGREEERLAFPALITISLQSTFGYCIALMVRVHMDWDWNTPQSTLWLPHMIVPSARIQRCCCVVFSQHKNSHSYSPLLYWCTCRTRARIIQAGIQISKTSIIPMLYSPFTNSTERNIIEEQ